MHKPWGNNWVRLMARVSALPSFGVENSISLRLTISPLKVAYG
jgi:hypothetical protein